jgi:hypothetical protein
MANLSSLTKPGRAIRAGLLSARPLLRRLRSLPVPELPPKDLPRRGARHLVDELDLAHPLVVGDATLHERDELVRGGGRVRSQLDEGLRDLAGLVVLLACRSRPRRSAGMLAEHRLDLRVPTLKALANRRCGRSRRARRDRGHDARASRGPRPHLPVCPHGGRPDRDRDGRGDAVQPARREWARSSRSWSSSE